MYKSTRNVRGKNSAGVTFFAAICLLYMIIELSCLILLTAILSFVLKSGTTPPPHKKGQMKDILCGDHGSDVLWGIIMAIKHLNLLLTK